MCLKDFTSWVAWLRQATQLDPQKNNPLNLHGFNTLEIELELEWFIFHRKKGHCSELVDYTRS